MNGWNTEKDRSQGYWMLFGARLLLWKFACFMSFELNGDYQQKDLVIRPVMIALIHMIYVFCLSLSINTEDRNTGLCWTRALEITKVYSNILLFYFKKDIERSIELSQLL